MTRRVRLAALAVLVVLTTGAAIAVLATPESNPQPTPTRVYSSCLAADTRPLAEGEDPCAGN